MNQLTYLLTGKPHPMPYVEALFDGEPRPPEKTRTTFIERGEHERWCRECDQVKPLVEFSTAGCNAHGTTNYRHICKSCRNAIRAATYKTMRGRK